MPGPSQDQLMKKVSQQIFVSFLRLKMECSLNEDELNRLKEELARSVKRNSPSKGLRSIINGTNSDDGKLR